MLPSSSIRKALIIILFAAVGLRLISAVYQGNNVTVLPGIYDQISYDGLARRFVDGYGFSFGQDHWPMTPAGQPTAHWSYLYTFYLVAIYTLFGPQPLAARLLQAVIVGVLQTYLTYRIAEKTFSKRVGVIAAGINALYLYFVYYGGALMTEPFYITAILGSLFIATLCDEHGNK